MKYQSVRFHEFGAPADVLSYETEENLTATPLKSGEVRVSIQFAPINPADLNYIQGNYGIRPSLPAVPGVESAGVVTESSSEIISVGDQVIFITDKFSGVSLQQIITRHTGRISIAVLFLV